MNSSQTFYLAQDILSHFKKGHVYGIMGTPVVEVSRYNDVVIVQDKKGEKYPVLENKLIKK